MAPFISLLVLLACALSPVLASPHIARNVHPHVHRAVAPNVPHRAMNKRCVPRPSNTTALAPTSTGPINVAPIPSVAHSSLASSLPATTSSLSSSYVPTTSETPSSTSSYVPTTSETPSSTSTPPPTTSSAAPTTSSTPPPPTTTTTTTSSPPPAQTSSSSGNSCEPSFLCGEQYGWATYYNPGLGACGVNNGDNDMIVAVDEALFDAYPSWNGANPNDNPVCGRQLTVYYGGNSVTLTVRDRCSGCHNITSLDLSPAAFSILANEAVGTMPISWDWIS